MGDNGYQYLEPRPGGNYKQWYVKGRRIRAVILASNAQGEDARTPEELALDFEVPLGAVLEAIDYCRRHADVVREDAEREAASIRASGLDKAPFVPTDHTAS